MTDPVQDARAFCEAHPEIDVLEAFGAEPGGTNGEPHPPVPIAGD